MSSGAADLSDACLDRTWIYVQHGFSYSEGAPLTDCAVGNQVLSGELEQLHGDHCARLGNWTVAPASSTDKLPYYLLPEYCGY